MSVRDRWHLSRPPAGAKRCGKHKKVPSAEHGIGLQWQVVGVDDQRQPVKRNFEFEADAKQFDAELKASVRAGTYVDDRAGQVTFHQFAEDWRRTRSHGWTTAERIERALRNHVYSGEARGRTPRGRVAIGDYPMSVLARRVSLVRDWIADSPLHPNSLNLLVVTVSAIFDAAVEDRVISRNPLKAKSVDVPDRIKERAVAWPASDVQAVCSLLPARLRGLGWLGACTGMRQGELFAVSVDDVDWLRRTVRVGVSVKQVGGGLAFGQTKGKNVRTVPVSRHVVPLLSRHVELFRPVQVTLPWSQKGHPDDGKPVTRSLLFTDHQARAWYRQSANRDWTRAWNAAGVKDAGRANGMHVLRHSAASAWLSKGLNPARVADWLGDTVAVLLDTYAHFLPEDDDLGRDIMDAFLAPLEAPELPETSLLDGN